jgi:hypothetical protein
VDRSIYAPTSKERSIRCVDDGIHLLFGDVPLHDLNSWVHGSPPVNPNVKAKIPKAMEIWHWI